MVVRGKLFCFRQCSSRIIQALELVISDAAHDALTHSYIGSSQTYWRLVLNDSKRVFRLALPDQHFTFCNAESPRPLGIVRKGFKPGVCICQGRWKFTALKFRLLIPIQLLRRQMGLTAACRQPRKVQQYKRNEYYG